MKTILTILFILLSSLGLTAQTMDSQYILPAKKYGKWGFIDKDGSWIIKPKFDQAHYFSEGVAAVQFYGEWGFIDRMGNWEIEPKYNDAKPFEEGLSCVMLGNKWGIIRKDGSWFLKPTLSMVSSFSNGMALLNDGGEFSFINNQGTKVLSYDFEHALPFSEGLSYVEFNDQTGYITLNGSWQIKCDYEEAYSFSEGLALVKKGGKYGFINQKGELVIEAKYDDANYFNEGIAAVKQDSRWKYINQSGNVVIDRGFERALPFYNDHAVAKYGPAYGLIDKQGKWVLPPEYSELGRFSNALSLADQVKNKVELMFADWQLKGEFEKTSDYLARVSEDKNASKIHEFSEAATLDLAKDRVNLNQTTLGLYDADHEKFNVFIPGAKSIMLPVPLDQAKSVKENWDRVMVCNANYAISGDAFLITTLEASYLGQQYFYDISQDFGTAANPTLNLDFDQISYNIIPNIATELKQSHSATIGQSDVDTNIPITKYSNPNVFALVIGNEDYSSYQLELNTSKNVSFASADASIFTKYLTKTLGVPKENVTLLTNATAGQMRQSVARLGALSEAYEGEAELIFYYAGHGLPKDGTNEPYLIPVDVSSSNLDYALRLEDVYRKLTEHPAKKVTIFLDACFSGGARNHELVATRGIRVKPKSPFVNGNLIVFAASSQDQTAYPYNEKAHGIFTYYLLKGWQISEGGISYGELEDFVRTNVMRKSVVVNDKVQIPEVLVSPTLTYSWKNMTFLPQKIHNPPIVTSY